MPTDHLIQPQKILAISGSLRSGSFNTALLRAAQNHAPAGAELTLHGLKGLPFYDGDVEAAGDPPEVKSLKAAIRAADGVIFATPEYNHGTSGVLKNAVDWASRDRGRGSLTGKPVTVIGAGGFAGTARAQIQLQYILAEAGAHVLAKPGVFVTLAWEKFNRNGELTDEATADALRAHLVKFSEWVRTLRRMELPVAS